MNRISPLLRAATAILLCALAGWCSAASFDTSCPAKEYLSGGCAIVMTGKIEHGDQERLLIALGRPLPAPGFFRTLVLNSPGGDVQEAFKLSDIVIRAALDTATLDSNVPISEETLKHPTSCVSACFLVWVAGAYRVHNSYADGVGLGLHRPYFAPEAYVQQDAGTAAQQQQESFQKVRAHLRRFEVPDALIDLMMARSSREVYWLGSDKEMLFAMFGTAPWFEESMIARCGFDPAYDRDGQAQLAQEFQAAYAAKRPAQYSPKVVQYRQWRQNYNACEYAFRRQSQTQLLASR